MNLPTQLTGLKEKWEQGEPARRKPFLIIVGLSFLVMAALLYIAFRPNYVTVFHGLALEDAAEITSELQNKRISSKLANGGTAISVPRKQADLARLEAAAAGLPRSGRVGYDLLNKSSFSMTESERTLQLQMLLEEELGRTLQKISSIQDAEVKLALPKDNVFLDPKRQTKPTAAVWIKATGTLDSAQIGGLVHLVSRAVPDLTPDNVTVIDAEGRVLNSGSEVSGPSFSDQQSRQQALQRELERSINSLLGQIFGEEHVAVRVAAELDFDQRSTESVRFQSPTGDEEGLVRQIEEMSEYYNGEGAAGAPPGTDTNPGEVYQTPSAGHSSTESEKRQRAITYELDEIRETITYAPGALKRLTVSVIINNTDHFIVDTEKVRAAVEAAVGFDALRQDLVSVQTMDFVGESSPAPTPVLPWYSSFSFLLIGAAIVAVLVILFVVRAVLRRRQAAALAELQLEQMAAAVQEEVKLPEPVDDETEILRRHLDRIARQKPESFAFLIRAWLNEESS